MSRWGSFRQVADNLQVKEVWVGESERRKGCALYFNAVEAERRRQH